MLVQIDITNIITEKIQLQDIEDKLNKCQYDILHRY